MTRSNWGLLLTGAPLALALGMGPVSGADLALKAKPYVKAPIIEPFSWTGWYIGANAGYAVGQGEGTYTAVPHPALLLAQAPTAFAGGFNAAPGGGFVGGQLGYNYQLFGNIVVGAETDIQGADISGGSILFGPGSIDHKLNWFGTTRVRAGLATGPVLSYVTGGVAYGGVKTGVDGFTTSETKTGWTWGAGVEAALGGNWSAKAEYLYLDLGSTDAASPDWVVHAKNQEQIFRAGLNYRFGGPAQPAFLGPTRNWAGLFVGGTIGSGIGRNDSTFDGTGESFELSPRGWDFGGIAGYNWQFGNWVAGVEGDFQDSSGKGYLTSLADGTLVDQKLSWFSTVRGRLGYGVGDTLFYATGGGAFGRVKNVIDGASFSHSVSGFAVGGGIENKLDLFGWLGPNWTTRTEYLYLDLGSVSDKVPTGTLSSDVREHVWRTVVSYKF